MTRHASTRTTWRLGSRNAFTHLFGVPTGARPYTGALTSSFFDFFPIEPSNIYSNVETLAVNSSGDLAFIEQLLLPAARACSCYPCRRKGCIAQFRELIITIFCCLKRCEMFNGLGTLDE